MYNLSTKAHDGPQQPTKADAGPRRGKRAQTTPDTMFGLAWVSYFFNVFFFHVLQYNLSTKAHEGTQRPTKAHSSQRRPTQAHEEGKGPKRRQMRRLGWHR